MNDRIPTHAEQLVTLRAVLERNGTPPAEVDRLFEDVHPAGIGTVLRWATEVDLLSASARAEREKIDRRRTVFLILVFLLILNLARSIAEHFGWIPAGLSDLAAILSLGSLAVLAVYTWRNL